MTTPAIDQLVPHAGAMCLLERVVGWDEARIHCRSTTHRRSGHPLADDRPLSCLALIEYAAQATAAHGRLIAPVGANDSPPLPGRLVALRDIELPGTAAALAVAGTLDIHAVRRLSGRGGAIYDVRVLGDDRPLMRGRLTIMTPGAEPA